MTAFPESCQPPRDGLPREPLLWMVFGSRDEITPHLVSTCLVKGDRVFVVEWTETGDTRPEINISTVTLNGLPGPIIEARASIPMAVFPGGGENIVNELLNRCMVIFGILPQVVVNLEEHGLVGPGESQHEHELRSTFSHNFGRVFIVCRAILAAWKNRNCTDKRVIINKTGTLGILGAPGLGALCASQFAIDGFSETLALENEGFANVVILESSMLHERGRNPVAALVDSDMGSPIIASSPMSHHSALVGSPLNNHSPTSNQTPLNPQHSPVMNNMTPVHHSQTPMSQRSPMSQHSPLMRSETPLTSLLQPPLPAVEERQLPAAYADSAAIYGLLIAQQLREKRPIPPHVTYVPCTKPRVEDEPVVPKKRKAEEPPPAVPRDSTEVSFVDLVAATVWEAAHCANPPLRLCLGRQAVKLHKEKLRLNVEEIEDWKYLYGHWED
ncbi:hypothetical protein B0I73DRAFT_133715 [Yarrowia lipolytica]|nr:hypothetical protein B0I73DRAFT_133715 [Yarrowia lipolytica]RDW44924.1 hypothetical protein B0I74DRAFT_139606 [Yarrowia lipolytica]RDW51748.1 hypothetical protein B0I75DRAFT_139350 [Yarrowia lipolytica]